MNRVLLLCLIALPPAFNVVPPEAAPSIIEKARNALQRRSAGFRNCSFQIVARRRVEAIQQSRRQETTETVYRGPNGELKRERPRSPRAGASAPGAFPLEGRGPRFSETVDSVSLDLLLGASDLLTRADVGGSRVIGGVSCRRLRVRPKIEGLEGGKIFVWVEEATGMPLRVETSFLVGPFGEGKAVLDLRMDPELGFSLPSTQRLTVETSGPMGPDGSGETLYEWKEFRWNLTFPAGFFTAAGPAGRAQGGAQARGTATGAPGRSGAESAEAASEAA